MVDAAELVITSSYKNLLMLTILENHEAKTVEMVTTLYVGPVCWFGRLMKRGRNARLYFFY